MKIYVTRYALTKGVLVFVAREPPENGMVVCKSAGGMNGCEYFHGKDWYTDQASAMARAESMRVHAIYAANKKIAALEKMTFKVTEVT